MAGRRAGRQAWRVVGQSASARPQPPAPRSPLVERIAAVYERGFAQYVQVATAIAGDAERGRDAVQEAFARAIAGCGAYRGEGPLEAWLWRAVVNAARNQRRASGRAACTPDAGERADAAQDHADAVVRRQIALLPERQRLVLFLRYYADLSYGEIAEVAGVRTGTVSATLAAAHRTLRGRLGAVAA
jgi:RNA polymerase sigma-70 factor (ECF subfamily)